MAPDRWSLELAEGYFVVWQLFPPDLQRPWVPVSAFASGHGRGQRRAPGAAGERGVLPGSQGEGIGMFRRMGTFQMVYKGVDQYSI